MLLNACGGIVSARGPARHWQAGGALQMQVQEKHILSALTQKANTNSHCLTDQKKCQWTSC